MNPRDAFNTSRSRAALLAILVIAIAGAATGLDAVIAGLFMGMVAAWACQE